MTRVRDLPEAEWRAHQDRVRRAIESVDEVNARLAERAAQRQANGSDYTERRRREDDEWMQRQHQEWEARQKEPVTMTPPDTVRPTMDQASSTAWNKWCDQRISRKLTRFAGHLGEEIGKSVKEERARIREEFEARVQGSDTATVALLLDLEKRIAELEQRAMLKPIKPKLVAGGGGDATG